MRLPAIVLVLIVALCAAARADEGMWTFDNFPAAVVKAKYGVTIDQKWLDHVRAASVRLSTGCSASVVTGSGLVLTNHHCVRDCAQNLSSATTNYVHDGFSAARREDEQLCPGMQAEILDGISDVTPAINAAAAGKSGGDYVKARDAAIAAAEKTGCAGREAQFRCQVITLYQGGQYKLYRYRKYADVRLAFAPEEQTAFFGGDPDNFNFPRYDLDFSFVRLYENGKPVTMPDHLTWSAEAPKDGAPIFISGNPGSTQRLLTADQLMFLRDLQLPETLILYSELRGRLIRFASESAEHARTSEGLLFGIENSFKAYHGEEQALVDPALIAAKTRYDRDLQAAVKKDAALSASIGDPWVDIAAVQPTRRALYRPYYFMEARAGQGSDLYRYARALVRAATERAKPNGERLPEYTDSKLALLQKTLLDAEPVYSDVEQLVLEFWLSKLRENLTADGEGTKVFLGKDSPETLSAALAKSALGDPALRKRLWDGGKAAIDASTDPMIVFARRVDAASRAIRKQYEDKVLGPTDRAAEKIAKARFAIHGTSDYPDATFSLRLSYGAVQGWEEDGKPVAPFTRFAGLWSRATGQFPFNLASKWQQAEGKVNPDTVFDFISNNDIIGGNSGSPAITAKGEVVGAAFDGNIHSLGGAFGFDPKTNRTVMVSTAAVTEALRKVYGNARLVTELTSR
jgi:V8-like Glu-specific endopeptidase